MQIVKVLLLFLSLFMSHAAKRTTIRLITFSEQFCSFSSYVNRFRKYCFQSSKCFAACDEVT